MNNFKIIAKVKDIKDTEQVTEKFKKRTLWVDLENDKYPQVLSIDFTQAGCEKLDNISIGEEVNITFSLKGREYNGKVFNSLNGFAIEKVNKAYNNTEKKSESVVFGDDDNSLPF